MRTNTIKKLKTIEKTSNNHPSIPKARKSKGGFEKFSNIDKCFVTCRNEKRKVVDTLDGCGLTGRVEGLALSQSLTYFFYSRGWI
jgi:hypothetical protein